MVQNIREIITVEKNMEKDCSYGVIKVTTKETLLIIIFMVREHMNGLMEENIKVNGQIIRWKGMANLLGKMEKYLQENTKMIKKKDMEYSNGQMERNIEDNGKMENNMVQVYIQIEENKKKVSGLKAKESDGFMNEIIFLKQKYYIYLRNNFL